MATVQEDELCFSIPSKKSKRDVMKEEQHQESSDADDDNSDSLFGGDYEEREATGDLTDESGNGADIGGQVESCSSDVLWDDSGEMIMFPFTRKERLLFPVGGNEPVDYFRLIFTDKMMQQIINDANNFAETLFLSPSTTEKSRITAWKDITLKEFHIFVGLLLHMGQIRINNIQDYWKQDPLFNIAIFSQNMSRNRFLLIIRTLNFSGGQEAISGGENRLIKVQGIIDMFNKRMSEVYYPCRELVLDECMVLWHGRLIHRQEVKNQRHKYGLKLYMLTTPSGIVQKFLVSLGVLDGFGGKDHIENIVMDLMDGKLNCGHSLYLEDYYNSYNLAKLLHDHKTHCTGPLRLDQRNIPKQIKQTQLKRGETICKYSDGIMIGKWRDQSDIAYISNQFPNELIKVQSAKSFPRPLPLIHYTAFTAEIDRQEQILAYHPCDQKTLRWRTKIFLHILQLTVVNALGLFIKFSGQKMSLCDFRLAIVRRLLKIPTVSVTPTPVQTDHVLVVREKSAGGKVMRKHCKSCYSKKKRKDTTYVCSTCPKEPGYCLDCATIIHK